MSAIASLWAKWILDKTKPAYTIDLVPAYWRDEVQELLDEEKKNGS